MSGARQVFLGFFMALLSSAIVLGSLSLSLLEGGYVLALAPTSASGEMVFEGEQILQLAENEVESNIPGAPVAPVAGVVILTPASNLCVHPQGWIKIIVRPEHSLSSLAHLYDSNIKLLKDGNCMKTDGLVVNSELYVPPAPPRTATPRPTYRPPVYWTPYPTIPFWPTPTPWIPTRTPVTPPPTPPTLPPTPLPTAQPTPPTPFPTAPPTQPLPTEPLPTDPLPTEPPLPTDPPATEPPLPTSLPPTEPLPPTPVPPTPQPLPTSQPPPQPTAQQPPPQPTVPPPDPTSPPEQQPTAPAPSFPDP